MLNLYNEISYEMPFDSRIHIFNGGEPILYAYGCALLECDTGKSFIYKIINLKNGKSEILSRKSFPLTQTDIIDIVDRMRKSKLAGAGRLLVDRPAGEQISYGKANEILKVIFTEILPEYGYTIRKEQLDLAAHILSDISRRNITLAESEVGTGKTLAYLIPAIIAKRGRLNDFWNMGLYPDMQYAHMSKMPIVIATSSIALQKAILTEHIPEISNILMENGVIKTPLTAVLRKGKEHYLCERNLRQQMNFESNMQARRDLESLLLPSGTIDLAETDLTQYIKRKISVSGRCFNNCPERDNCPYLEFRQQAESPDIDIQVCNHNYLLADTMLRADHKKPLIPNYQMLIIDEGHKFLLAARTMFGMELSNTAAPEILETVDRLSFKRENFKKQARRLAKKLYDESARLFKGFIVKSECEDVDDEAGDGYGGYVVCKNNDCDVDDADCFRVEMDYDAARHLRNIRDIAESLSFILRDEAFYIKAGELLKWVRDKYGIDTEQFSLKKLFAEVIKENDTRKSQEELMRMLIIKLHNSICSLPGIKNLIEIERRNRQKRNADSTPESNIIYGSKSSVSDTIWHKAKSLLPVDGASGNYSYWIVRLLWSLEQISKQVDALAKHKNLISWLESDEDERRLCAIPKDIDKRLYDNQWCKGIPTVLTSGTLSAGGDFTHTKRTLGLEMAGSRLSEISKPSPFNYRKNALMYISETTPFPDNKNKRYIDAITDEVESLIYAAHGHTAVLFTSYNVMGKVYAVIKQRGLPYPMFRLDKGGVLEIKRFKHSNGGVLFASGALWEGIDIPGDALSMLIIVKLPFAVPDPIGEYEQTLYNDMDEYKRRVVVPEMLIKLKQGFGRLIRTESDTGVVAILDSRAGLAGNYRTKVLETLPNCQVTANIGDVERFFIDKKELEYFNSQHVY